MNEKCSEVAGVFDSGLYYSTAKMFRGNRKALQRQRNAIVIYSPYSGRSAQLSQALTSLQQVEVNVVQFTPIADLDKLPPQGTHWRDSGIDVAIAAGGDGLVGGVITHIAESGLPLGILPLGTANDIARSLNIPLDLSEAAKVIALGKEIEVDIGEAQTSLQCRALQVTVINAPIFGGQWNLAIPGAAMNDRLLDIVVIEDIDLEDLSTTIGQFFNTQKQPLTLPSGWERTILDTILRS